MLLFFKIYFIEVQLIYNVVLISALQQSDSHINVYICIFFSFINLFTYIWLHWVSVAVRGLSLVAASGGYSWLQCAGFSLRWLLLLQSTGSRRVVFSSCGTRAQ